MLVRPLCCHRRQPGEAIWGIPVYTRSFVRAWYHRRQRKCICKWLTEAWKDGADGVIFGCTEGRLLVSASDFDMPVFDSTALHAKAAIDFALGS